MSGNMLPYRGAFGSSHVVRYVSRRGRGNGSQVDHENEVGYLGSEEPMISDAAGMIIRTAGRRAMELPQSPAEAVGLLRQPI